MAWFSMRKQLWEEMAYYYWSIRSFRVAKTKGGIYHWWKWFCAVNTRVHLNSYLLVKWRHWLKQQMGWGAMNHVYQWNCTTWLLQVWKLTCVDSFAQGLSSHVVLSWFRPQGNDWQLKRILSYWKSSRRNIWPKFQALVRWRIWYHNAEDAIMVDEPS